MRGRPRGEANDTQSKSWKSCRLFSCIRTCLFDDAGVTYSSWNNLLTAFVSRLRLLRPLWVRNLLPSRNLDAIDALLLV